MIYSNIYGVMPLVSFYSRGQNVILDHEEDYPYTYLSS